MISFAYSSHLETLFIHEPLKLDSVAFKYAGHFLGREILLSCSSPTGNATESWILGFGLFGHLKLFQVELGFFNKVIFQLYFIS